MTAHAALAPTSEVLLIGGTAPVELVSREAAIGDSSVECSVKNVSEALAEAQTAALHACKSTRRSILVCVHALSVTPTDCSELSELQASLSNTRSSLSWPASSVCAPSPPARPGSMSLIECSRGGVLSCKKLLFFSLSSDKKKLMP